MRMWEIFEGYANFMEDTDALINAAKTNFTMAKKQMKQGEIAKLKDRTAKKQSELSKMAFDNK